MSNGSNETRLMNSCAKEVVKAIAMHDEFASVGEVLNIIWNASTRTEARRNARLVGIYDTSSYRGLNSVKTIYDGHKYSMYSLYYKAILNACNEYDGVKLVFKWPNNHWGTCDLKDLFIVEAFKADYRIITPEISIHDDKAPIIHYVNSCGYALYDNFGDYNVVETLESGARGEWARLSDCYSVYDEDNDLRGYTLDRYGYYYAQDTCRYYDDDSYLYEYDDYYYYYEDNVPHARLIQGYHDHHGAFKHIGLINNNMKFAMGLELETECINYGDPENIAEAVKEINPDLFVFEHDGSLDNGVECITNIISFYYLWKEQYSHLRDICKAIVDHDGRSHDTSTCGLHVHINRDYYGNSDEVERRLIYLVEKFRTNIEIFSRRRGGHYCMFRCDESRDDKYKKDYAKNCDKYDTRYCNINFMNNYTIEFRMFRGTLNPDTIIASVGLCYALLNTAIDYRDDNALDHVTWNDILSNFEIKGDTLNSYSGVTDLMRTYYNGRIEGRPRNNNE